MSHGKSMLRGGMFVQEGDVYTGYVPGTSRVRHTGYVTGTSHRVRHTGYVTPGTSHWVRRTGYSTPGTTHQVQHTGYSTPGASHRARHTGYVTPGKSHQVCLTGHVTLGTHAGCVIPGTSHRPLTLGASHQAHTGYVSGHIILGTYDTRCNTLGASYTTRTPDESVGQGWGSKTVDALCVACLDTTMAASSSASLGKSGLLGHTRRVKRQCHVFVHISVWATPPTRDALCLALPYTSLVRLGSGLTNVR